MSNQSPPKAFFPIEPSGYAMWDTENSNTTDIMGMDDVISFQNEDFVFPADLLNSIDDTDLDMIVNRMGCENASEKPVSYQMNEESSSPSHATPVNDIAPVSSPVDHGSCLSDRGAYNNTETSENQVGNQSNDLNDKCGEIGRQSVPVGKKMYSSANCSLPSSSELQSPIAGLKTEASQLKDRKHQQGNDNVHGSTKVKKNGAVRKKSVRKRANASAPRKTCEEVKSLGLEKSIRTSPSSGYGPGHVVGKIIPHKMFPSNEQVINSLVRENMTLKSTICSLEAELRAHKAHHAACHASQRTPSGYLRGIPVPEFVLPSVLKSD